MFIRKQRNGWECGVIAVYNAHVLAKMVPPSLVSIKKLLRSNKHGTSELHMKRMIKTLGWKPKKVRKVTIVGYMVGDIGHYTVLRGGYAYNFLPDDELIKTSHKYMKKRVKVDESWLKTKLKDKNTEIYGVR